MDVEIYQPNLSWFCDSSLEMTEIFVLFVAKGIQSSNANQRILLSNLSSKIIELPNKTVIGKACSVNLDQINFL